MTNKPKKKVSNIVLVIACIMIIVYAAANFVLQYHTSIEVSPTLTNAWFTFWGGELLCITGIKITKVLTRQDNDSTSCEDENDA